MMAEYLIIKEGEYYLSIETEHFYFDVYKAWNGTGGGAMFRAGNYIKKKGEKKYYIDYELFPEWDYKDKQTAFEEAKAYIFDYMKHLSNELLPTVDVEEVKHGEWEFVESQYTTVAGVTMKGVTEYRCSVCGHREIFKHPYCNCGAKMGR